MNHVIMRHCVFIDECGCNIWTARNHGRARQGERAYRHVCGLRGRNVTLALAVSPVIGLEFYSAYREVKHDVYGKRQTAKMKLLPSVFSSLYSRIKTFVFAVNSKRNFSIFV